jgi:hypothetical protein
VPDDGALAGEGAEGTEGAEGAAEGQLIVWRAPALAAPEVEGGTFPVPSDAKVIGVEGSPASFLRTNHLPQRFQRVSFRR